MCDRVTQAPNEYEVSFRDGSSMTIRTPRENEAYRPIDKPLRSSKRESERLLLALAEIARVSSAPFYCDGRMAVFEVEGGNVTVEVR